MKPDTKKKGNDAVKRYYPIAFGKRSVTPLFSQSMSKYFRIKEGKEFFECSGKQA